MAKAAFEIVKSEREWRAQLTLPLHCLRPAAFLLGYQVQQRHWLAKLLCAAR
jgi:hypothetical protein